jgi:hypothetical protein
MQKHNPDYKLVSKDLHEPNRLIELVYGISNEGENEGLEAYYFKKDKSQGHYRSFRWDADSIPSIYEGHFEQLKQYAPETPEGHKNHIGGISTCTTK